MFQLPPFCIRCVDAAVFVERPLNSMTSTESKAIWILGAMCHLHKTCCSEYLGCSWIMENNTACWHMVSSTTTVLLQIQVWNHACILGPPSNPPVATSPHHPRSPCSVWQRPVSPARHSKRADLETSENRGKLVGKPLIWVPWVINPIWHLI